MYRVSNGKHRHGDSSDDILRCVSYLHSPQTTGAVSSHDDKIHLLLFCNTDNCVFGLNIPPHPPLDDDVVNLFVIYRKIWEPTAQQVGIWNSEICYVQHYELCLESLRQGDGIREGVVTVLRKIRGTQDRLNA